MNFLFKNLTAQKTLSGNSIRLLSISSLFILANSLATVFVTVFVWKLTESFVTVAVYNISIYVFMPIGFILGGYISSRKGTSLCIRIGMAALIIYFALILVLKGESVKYIHMLGCICGIGTGLFYYSNNTLLYYYTDLKNRSFYLGLTNSLGAIMSIVSPTISGFIIVNEIDYIGYYYVFIITFLLYVIAGIISLFLDDKGPETTFRFSLIRQLRKDANWRLVLQSNFFLGFREGAIYFIIDILYFITFGDELSLGGFTTLISFIGVVSAFLVGKYIKAEFYSQSILIGGVFLLVVTILMISSTTSTSVIGYGVVTSLFNYFWLIPITVIHYRVADSLIKKDKSMGDFMISKEIPLAFGRIAGILLFIVVEVSELKSISVKIILPILNSMVLVAFLFFLSKIKFTKS